MQKNEHKTYVPALRFRWLTRHYDRVVGWTTRENVFRRKLLGQAGVGEGDSILDLGCGTGTLAAMLKSGCPAADVQGLDGDPEVLALVRWNLSQAWEIGLFN